MPPKSTGIPSHLLELCNQAFVGASVGAASAREPAIVSPLAGLRVLRHPVRTAFEATIYEPVLCLIVQGGKQTTLGAETYAMRAGECLLISHDLPCLSRIVDAPYVALLLDVELDTLRGLYEEVGASTASRDDARALEVQRAPATLLDALARYLALRASATDARVLGPMIAREIHYRLLTAPFGGMLRSLLRHDSHASAVARAIAHIRAHFREPVEVSELAREVGMSVSSLHRQFKAVTASSPLQYQKELRLLEAQRRLKAGSVSVSMAAYEVGYESPNQFSREYARKFGRPPRDEVAKASA